MLAVPQNMGFLACALPIESYSFCTPDNCFLWGIHVRRDTLLSIAYSEELISSTISATLQNTD